MTKNEFMMIICVIAAVIGGFTAWAFSGDFGVGVDEKVPALIVFFMGAMTGAFLALVVVSIVNTVFPNAFENMTNWWNEFSAKLS